MLLAFDVGNTNIVLGVFDDGKLIITDTDDVTTEWVWISWGLEKL